jgi:uncharacterized protein YkwD
MSCGKVRGSGDGSHGMGPGVHANHHTGAGHGGHPSSAGKGGSHATSHGAGGSAHGAQPVAHGSPGAQGAGGGAHVSSGDGSSTSTNPQERALIDGINQARAERGLKPLTHASNLTKAASENDAANQRSGLGHHISLGNNNARGEITAMNSNMTPAAAIRQWINSPGHAEIMFDPNMTKIGASLSGNFSTVDFS